MLKLFVRILISITCGIIIYGTICSVYNELFDLVINASTIEKFFILMIPFSSSIAIFIWLPKFVNFNKQEVDQQPQINQTNKKSFALQFNMKLFKFIFLILISATILLSILIDFIPSNDPGGFGGLGTIVVFVFGTIISAIVSCILAFIVKI